MKQISLLTILLITSSIISCTKELNGTGEIEILSLPLDGIEQINLDGNFKVNLIDSNQKGGEVLVRTHQNLIENLLIEIENNILVLSENQSVEDFNTYEIDIRLDGLEELKVTGEVILNSQEIREKSLEVSTSANATVNLNLNVKSLQLKTTDNSKLLLSGKARTTVLDSNGFSELKGIDFTTQTLEVNIEDNAQVEVAVKRRMYGVVSDQANLFYRGKPKNETYAKDDALIVEK